MSMSRQRQREIMREDAKRRNARQALEDAMLGLNLNDVDPLSDAAKVAAHQGKAYKVNPCLVRGIGTVNPPLPVRASRSSWDRGMRRNTTVGIAPGADPKDGPSYLRILDGKREVVSIRSTRKHEDRPTTSQLPHRTTAKDLKPQFCD